jgi:hypothetical protein
MWRPGCHMLSAVTHCGRLRRANRLSFRMQIGHQAANSDPMNGPSQPTGTLPWHALILTAADFRLVLESFAVSGLTDLFNIQIF